MNTNVLKFNDVPWNQLNEFAKQKQLSSEDKLLRLLELAPGFHEPDWCLRGHVGFVLSGKLDIQYPDRVESYSSGDGLVVPPGQKHKALKTSETVTLFLVEEA